ncbi:DNA cytosine methyltransferase [Nocardia sp. KC 131]|uniref:DNA cytosine methyltransferase n=1 Tax=Nocardia arseniciresistens TaxID=3392119 RepID=UPI00398F214F
MHQYSFYEFFAGGGMARAGLGANWKCLLANDFDDKKVTIYNKNWHPEPSESVMVPGDVAKLTVEAARKHGDADLVWGSFPCQDLSLAGNGAGLSGERSGSFHPFWNLVKGFRAAGSAPRVVVLENVVGALTSEEGQAFSTLGNELEEAGYNFGAVVINASHWVPQSRPRLFIIAIDKSQPVPDHLVTDGPDGLWHTKALRTAYGHLAPAAKKSWLWWKLPEAPAKRDEYQTFADLIEGDEPEGVAWNSPEVTERLVNVLMNPVNQAKVEAAKKYTKEKGGRRIGTVYKRMRPEGKVTAVIDGKEIRAKVQRAEVRFDEVAGCLRTPSGGSSRQTILVVEGDSVRSRLLSPREAARLMGLPDDYQLPERYNDAYHLAGDGVAVNVVRFLAQNLIEPLVAVSADQHPASAEEQAA